MHLWKLSLALLLASTVAFANCDDKAKEIAPPSPFLQALGDLKKIEGKYSLADNTLHFQGLQAALAKLEAMAPQLSAVEAQTLFRALQTKLKQFMATRNIGQPTIAADVLLRDRLVDKLHSATKSLWNKVANRMAQLNRADNYLRNNPNTSWKQVMEMKCQDGCPILELMIPKLSDEDLRKLINAIAEKREAEFDALYNAAEASQTAGDWPYFTGVHLRLPPSPLDDILKSAKKALSKRLDSGIKP